MISVQPVTGVYPVAVLTRLAACAVVASLTLLAGCNESGSPNPTSTTPSDPAASSATELAPATARGLAVGVLTHLASAEVTHASGSHDHGAISVMVETSNPDLEAVHVYVVLDPDIEALPCSTDFGYRSTMCRTDARSTTEVLVRKSRHGDMPDLMGRFYDERRRNVLVQVWGARDEAERLVREVLADPLVGAVTSPAFNDEGEGLTEFKESRIESIEE